VKTNEFVSLTKRVMLSIIEAGNDARAIEIKAAYEKLFGRSPHFCSVYSILTGLVQKGFVKETPDELSNEKGKIRFSVTQSGKNSL